MTWKETLFKKNMILSALKTILDSEKYPTDKYFFIMKVIKEFELAYEINDFYKTKALVIADYNDKVIDLWITGEQKRDYFAIIRNYFQEIFKSFKKFKTIELVPINRELDRYVSPNIDIKVKNEAISEFKEILSDMADEALLLKNVPAEVCSK